MSAAPTVAVGYVRVSTSEQACSGAGLAAQRAAITAKATAEGWDLVAIEEDAGVSGGARAADRPALTAALAVVESGRAKVLIVAKLDRLTRSVFDFASLMERSKRKRWGIVCLDLGVDTSTPAGEMMANVLATFAQFERRLIGQRTKDALAEKKASGVVLGRPVLLPVDIEQRIVSLSNAGASLLSIAEGLNDDCVPTVQGGARWYASTVRAVLRRARARCSVGDVPAAGDFQDSLRPIGLRLL